MSNFTEIKKCRCCDNNVELLLDLNDQPLANSYHIKGEELEVYPLKLNICYNCYHTQLSIVVKPEIMFKNYLYVSGTSNTLKTYFDFFSKFTIERFKNYFNYNPSNVLDIACNDGTQLDYYKELGLNTYGVDPAENLYHLSKKHNVICDFFPSNKINDKFNLITAQNVFAHTDDIKTFLLECNNLLSDDGILYIQTSQANMIVNNEFDTIYHEHLSFFNTRSMKHIVERCGLKLNNVFKFDIHGTSYIFEISKSNYDSNIQSYLDIEYAKGLYNKDIYDKFVSNSKKVTSELKSIVESYKNDGYIIIGYGAAAKGMTLLNFGNINMDLIIDDNELKHKLYTPGMDILIEDISILGKINDKVVFIPLAWNFYNEIYKKIKTVRNNENDIFIKYFPNIEIKK